MVSKTKSKVSVLKLINIILLVSIGTILLYQSWKTANEKDEDLQHSNRQKREVGSTVSTGGIVYTQWGRQNCTSPGAYTVYSGVVGGSHYTHSGGGSNYLCLPMDPLWGNYRDAVVNRGLIYGAEYHLEGDNFPFYGRHDVLHDHNVPCAVCEQNAASKLVMIPARNKCYGGWTEAYHGYLMCDHHAHKGRTEFVCIDSDPDRDTAGYRAEYGVLFLAVEGKCGSLPCPPYVNGRELTCVVCIK